MKKQYFKPEILVEKLNVKESLLETTPNIDISNEEADPARDVLGKEREDDGSWGNIW